MGGAVDGRKLMVRCCRFVRIEGAMGVAAIPLK